MQFALLIVSVGCVGWAHAQLPVKRPDGGFAGFVPDPKQVHALAFGFDALLADFYWLEAVQVVGGSAYVDHDRADYLGKLVDVVTTLNPEVDHPYRFAAVWLTFDESQVRQSIRLLQRGIVHHGDDWRNHFYLGFARFFYLGEYELAAEALERAVHLPGAPAYLPRLVARLKAETSDIEVAEIFLREMLRNTQDPDDRAQIQIALDEIEIEYKARHLEAARSAYRRLAGHDVTDVEDLVRSPHRMLERLPSPEPDEIPPSLARGSRWKIDPKTNRIVSSYLGRRYEVNYTPVDRERLEAWKQARLVAEKSGGEK